MLLHYAAKWGDVETIRRLVAGGRSLSEKDFHGRTPLHWVVESHHATAESITALIGLGADPNERGRFCGPPIFHCRDAAKCRALLKHGADAKYIFDTGHTLLNWGGCASGECLDLILEAGADPGRRGDDGATALGFAVQHCNTDDVRLLLACGARWDDVDWTPLQRAVYIGTPEDVDLAIAAGGKPHETVSPYFPSAWVASLSIGYLEKADRLVRGGADPHWWNKSGESSLGVAAVANQVDSIQWLLTHGVPINARGGYYGSALSCASEAGGLQAVEYLLKMGADIQAGDAMGVRPIQMAKNLEIVKMLLAQGANLNEANVDWTLKTAVESGDETFVRGLIELGADVNVEFAGETALTYAVLWDERIIVRRLLDAGAHPDPRDADGWTPLFGVKSPEVAQMLLEAGADPGAKDEFNDQTALDYIDEPEVRAVIEAALT